MTTMINGVKARLQTVSELQSVELGHEVLEAALENMNPDPTTMPSVLLYYGNYNYSENEHKMYVRQTNEKRFVALLFCEVSDFDDLQDKVVKAVLGYCHTQRHTGMTVASSITAKLVGTVMARRIEFASEILISQQ